MKNKGKITIVGSNMVDLVTYLKRTPEKGETVFGKDFQQGFGGKGSNQAVMASLLGADVSIVTAIGDDAYGNTWMEHYKKENINTDTVHVMKNRNSGVAVIWVEPDGDNRIVITPGANEDITPELVASSFEKLPEAAVVMSQLENPQEAILEGFKLGKKNGATTILNPAPAEALQEDILTYTDWLVPNETELALLAKEMFQLEERNPVTLIKKFAEKTNTNIVMTAGPKGALVYMVGKNMDVEIIPTIEVKTKDTTGAGDAFCGAFAFGISNGLDPRKAIKLANVIASDSVQRNGTQTSYARGEALKTLVNQVL